SKEGSQVFVCLYCQGSAILRRVLDMQNHVPDSIRIKQGELIRDGDCPIADGTSPLEWQIAIIPKVQFEHPAIVLGTARRNCITIGDILESGIAINGILFIFAIGGK